MQTGVTECLTGVVCVVQGTTPSLPEAAAQLKKKHATEEVGNEQDW